MIISLITVGFAAWTINVPTDDVTQGGDFVADDVVLVEALSSPTFNTELRYNKNGFFTEYKYNEETKTITTNTYDKITYSLDVDFNLCKEKLNADKYQLRIRLKVNEQFENINEILNSIVIEGSFSDFNSYENEIDETTNEYVINLTISKSKIISENKTNVNITFNFSNLTIKENDSKLALKQAFFNTLASIEDNQAFIVATSLYAIYD
jgi:hypothetical protein